MTIFSDWQPDQYLLFADERNQPVLDLLGRIRSEPGRILDVGCGPGNSTGLLAARFPDAEIVGLDSSASMIDKARLTSDRIRWVLHDASTDFALGEFDLIFSNAALQWIPGTRELLPRLFASLAPGGIMAAQAPYIREAPVYKVIAQVTGQKEWQEYFREPVVYPLHHKYTVYYEILSQLAGHLTLWQTEYIHILDGHQAVVEWYKGSGLRPFLERLPEEKVPGFMEDYAAAIRAAYPLQANGKVLLPFNRVFFTIRK